MVRVEGTELVVSTGTSQLRSEALVGQTLTVGTHDVRLTSIKVDDGVTLHHFVLAADGAEICAPDAAGQRLAIPWTDEHGAVQLTCTSGAIGKCIRFGYPPSRAALHQSCIRMVRADYGGDGSTATRDGTRIEFCDRDGIHPCTRRRRRDRGRVDRDRRVVRGLSPDPAADLAREARRALPGARARRGLHAHRCVARTGGAAVRTISLVQIARVDRQARADTQAHRHHQVLHVSDRNISAGRMRRSAGRRPACRSRRSPTSDSHVDAR